MKRILSLVCVTMLTVAASAQITWNAKGGVGLATCWGDAEGLKTHFVGKAGVGIEKPLSSNLSLMPSLELAWKGAKAGEDTWEQQLDIFYLQAPIVFAYRLNLTDTWNLALKAGPYFAYAISDHFEEKENGIVNEKESGDADVDKFDAGLDIGIDFEHHRFVFGVEAEMGFIPLWKGNDSKTYNLAFYATIGWKF